MPKESTLQGEAAIKGIKKNSPLNQESPLPPEKKKLSPEERLQRMVNAQKKVEEMEAARIQSLLAQRIDLIQRKSDASEILQATQETLEKAKAVVAAKKMISPEYQKGLNDLSQDATEKAAEINALQQEIQEIENSPGMKEAIERQRIEEANRADEEMKKNWQAAAAERKRIQIEAGRKEREETEKRVNKLEGEIKMNIKNAEQQLIDFLEKDGGRAKGILLEYEKGKNSGGEYTKELRAARQKIDESVEKLKKNVDILEKRRNSLIPWLTKGLSRKVDTSKKENQEVAQEYNKLAEEWSGLFNQCLDLKRKLAKKIDQYNSLPRDLNYKSFALKTFSYVLIDKRYEGVGVDLRKFIDSYSKKSAEPEK